MRPTIRVLKQHLAIPQLQPLINRVVFGNMERTWVGTDYLLLPSSAAIDSLSTAEINGLITAGVRFDYFAWAWVVDSLDDVVPYGVPKSDGELTWAEWSLSDTPETTDGKFIIYSDGCWQDRQITHDERVAIETHYDIMMAKEVAALLPEPE